MVQLNAARVPPAPQPGQLAFAPRAAAVVTLDDSSFHPQVMDSDDLFFVEFYAPW